MALDKVIDSAELDANLTAVADAIRTKGGITEQLSFPDGFVNAVEGIQAGGGVNVQDVVDGMMNSTWPVGDVVMTGNKIKAHAFMDNTGITSIVAKNVTSISGEKAFYGCTNLVSADLSGLPSFYGANYTFQNCSKLAQVNIDNATVCGHSTFQDCKALTELRLPKLTTLYQTVFAGCSALKKVDFGSNIKFDRANTFSGCSSLKTLILRANMVSPVTNVTNFDNSPFASGGTGGTVYVPSALIEQYQQATNWSTLYAAGTCNFVAIEGSEYE